MTTAEPPRRPIAFAAFEGWNDAADAASGAVAHLAAAWDAKLVSQLDPDDFYDFQVNRPTVSLVDGVSRRLSWPTTTVSVCRGVADGRDVVLIAGLEPNMRWRQFCAALLAVCEDLEVSTLVTLGALLDDSPHTQPLPVMGTAYDPATAERFGLRSSRYEGPTGILGVLHDASVAIGLPALSFWVSVPHYVAQPPCPKATLTLLQRVEDVLDLAVPLGSLEDDAREWERKVDEATREDSEVADYVRSLEQRDLTTLPEASGDAIARDFERFLRRRDAG